jgi:hypothetical protein
MWNGHYTIELDEPGSAPLPAAQGAQAATDSELANGHLVSTASVDPDFFPTFEAAPLAGRLLGPADYGDAPRVAVVNQSFVQKVLGGRNAIGRRFRYQVDSAPAAPWREIVGVVRDIGMAVEPNPKTAGVYLPIRLREVGSVRIAARVSGDMTASTNALRSIVARADSALRVSDAQPLSLATANTLRTINYVVQALSVVSLAATILALSGIYAVMSFAVSRRTREIGIRVALGSKPSRVVFAILRRPLIQVTAGIAFGGCATLAIARLVEVDLGVSPGLVGYLLVMLSVCLLACVAPARRALKLDPIAALRTD